MAGDQMPRAYAGFVEPAAPELVAKWRYLMHCSRQLRDALESCAPEGKNRDEAIVRLDKAVMVVQGSFHVHPR